MPAPKKFDPRLRTGGLEIPKKDGVPLRWPSGRIRYRARLKWPDGSRPGKQVPEEYCYSEERAREYVRACQEEIDRRRAGLVAPDVAPSSEESDAWFNAWEASRKAKGLSSTRDNRSHWEHHIKPFLTGKHVRDWTAADMRALVRYLDGKVQAGEVHWKFAINVWATATKIGSDAKSSKLDSLRCRADDPCADVEGPDRGAERSKQYLYPSEFLRFVSCKQVPLAWRIAVAQAVYLYPRDGEHRVLRECDVDLEHGVASITRAWDRRAKKIKPTKPKRTRRFNIEPNLLPLLAALAHDDPTALIAKLPSERDMARGLRRWLKRARVDRPELHTTTETTKAMTWHDLRATGITWMAVRGDDPLKIKKRAGHERFETTERYVREAEAIRDGFGEVFPPLPSALVDAAAGREEPAEARAERPGTAPANRPNRHLTTRNVGGADGTRMRGDCRHADVRRDFACDARDVDLRTHASSRANHSKARDAGRPLGRSACTVHVSEHRRAVDLVTLAAKARIVEALSGGDVRILAAELREALESLAGPSADVVPIGGRRPQYT